MISPENFRYLVNPSGFAYLRATIGPENFRYLVKPIRRKLEANGVVLFAFSRLLGPWRVLTLSTRWLLMIFLRCDWSWRLPWFWWYEIVVRPR